MANYGAEVRSSYFLVKNEVLFAEFLGRFALTLITDEQDGVRLYGFMDENNGNGIPTSVYNEESGEDEEVDFAALLAEHLALGWAAEVREIGREKMRYLVGLTMVVRWDGAVVRVSLDDAQDSARHSWGDTTLLTACEY